MRNRNAKASFYNKVTSIQFGGLAAWKVKIGMLFLYHLLVLCADRLNNKWSKWRLLPAKEDNPSKCKQTHSTIRHDTITHWQSKHARTHAHITRVKRLIIKTPLPPVTKPKVYVYISCIVHLSNIHTHIHSPTRVYDILTYSSASLFRLNFILFLPTSSSINFSFINLHKYCLGINKKSNNIRACGDMVRRQLNKSTVNVEFDVAVVVVVVPCIEYMSNE